MTYKIKYLPLAVLDLDALASWLSRFYPGTLRRTMGDLKKKIGDLSSFPGMGSEYPSDPYYRKIACGNYLIFYHVAESNHTVEIHRILRASWNIPEYLPEHS